MTQVTPTARIQQEGTFDDSLTQLLREGARQLLAQAVEAELESFLARHSTRKMEDRRKTVVRNGYLPERTIQTGIGDVAIKVPKIRDRSGSGIKFTSNLLPPYLKRAQSVEEMLPWLYLKGVSTGQYQEALGALLGNQAKGLSANTISRLKRANGWRIMQYGDKKHSLASVMSTGGPMEFIARSGWMTNSACW